jgi:hypothetical protein
LPRLKIAIFPAISRKATLPGSYRSLGLMPQLLRAYGQPMGGAENIHSALKERNSDQGRFHPSWPQTPEEELTKFTGSTPKPRVPEGLGPRRFFLPHRTAVMGQQFRCVNHLGKRQPPQISTQSTLPGLGKRFRIELLSSV